MVNDVAIPRPDVADFDVGQVTLDDLRAGALALLHCAREFYLFWNSRYTYAQGDFERRICIQLAQQYWMAYWDLRLILAPLWSYGADARDWL